METLADLDCNRYFTLHRSFTNIARSPSFRIQHVTRCFCP